MPHKSPFPIGTLVIALGLVLLMLATYLLVKPISPPAELQGVLKPRFKMLAPFQLQAHGRAPLTRSDFEGRWSFVFFGYTHCPDVCANALHELARFRRLLDDRDAAAGDAVQLVLVSVDPERDGGAKLAAYAAHFHPAFIGATAGKGAIERFTRQFGADLVRAPQAASGQYLVAHTTAIFLVDPYGRLIAVFSEPHYAATILDQFSQIVAYYDAAGVTPPAGTG